MNEEPETKKSMYPWKPIRYAFYICAGIMFLGVIALHNEIPPFQEWPLVNQYCFFWLGFVVMFSMGHFCRS